MPIALKPLTGEFSLREIKSPCHPLEAFRRLRGREGLFFLDSALIMKGLSGYSFLGCEPFLTLKTKGRHVAIKDSSGLVEKEGNPFEELRHLMHAFHIENINHEIPFVGGAVGYLAYDLCHFIERLPSRAVEDMDFPDMYFGFYDSIIAYDHLKGKCLLVGINHDEGLYDRVTKLLRTDTPYQSRPSKGTNKPFIRGNLTKEGYLEAVKQAREYIAQGDIYQVNLSQRFQSEVTFPAHELYLRLRAVNPAPFSSYIQFDNKAVVSSSPERFLCLRSGHVQTRPIKGTRPRGKGPEADNKLSKALLESPKDNAELTMIVDLERNDLGRVCNYGSVQVSQKRVLEAHPTVFHLVATIEGELHPGCDFVDLLKATFPGGSVTGVPKIRAMEIIDELEPTRRGVYTGAIGYIGFNGNMDLGMGIRTFLVRDSTAFFQVGGGIVADSDPQKEYEETLHKARALMESLNK